MLVVTLSATYAAGGSQIAPRVAERLGLPFIDRAVPVPVAAELGKSVEETEAVARNAPGGWWRSLARMSSISLGNSLPAVQDDTVSEGAYLERTQEHLRQAADTTGAVILGHAAAVVLAGHSPALHVRLDGSPDGRVRAAMHQHGIDESQAQSKQRENDRFRAGYVKHFYHCDPGNPELYHLTIDTVRLRWDQAEAIIVGAAKLLV